MHKLYRWLAGWMGFEVGINKENLSRKGIERCKWEKDWGYEKQDRERKIEDIE